MILFFGGCAIAQPTSGKCGKNVTWTLLSDGTLVIEGAGSTYDYSKNPQKSPFVKKGIAERIKVVDLTRFHVNGHLGNNLFYGCRNLEKIKLHQSQRKMLALAVFPNCPLLATIEYSNSHIKSIKVQDNYYKIKLNAVKIGIPSVEQCIVPATSEKEEDLFKPLEPLKPFPPIESYDNLKKEKKGTYLRIGQWTNGNWNGVVKDTFEGGGMSIYNYQNGILVINGPHKEEYHWSIPEGNGAWFIHEEYDNKKTRIDYYYSNRGESPERAHCIQLRNTQLLRYEFSNSDCFIGTFDDKGFLTDKNTLIWANGNIYYGSFQTNGITFSHLGAGHLRIDNLNGAPYDVPFYMLKQKLNGKGIFYNAQTEEIQCGLWENGEYKGSPEVVTLQDFLEFPKALPFNSVAKIYVENEINEWQKKQEFETTAQWQTRVTDISRQRKANELFLQFQNDYLESFAQKINLHLKLGRYDADNRTFLVTDSVYGQMIVSLENISPQAFKASWEQIIPVPTYFLNGNDIDILEMDFMLDNKRVAHYQKSANLTYANVKIDYVFNPIALPQMETIVGGGDIVTVNPTGNPHITNPSTPPSSDVDQNIPVVNRTNSNTHVFIIANENYYKTTDVPYALNDGRVFKEYCEKTLGILPDNITMYENATLGMMRECVYKMKNRIRAFGKEANIIFYYAGHAISQPDESPYLFPVDGNSQLMSTAYSEKELFDVLGDTNVNSVTCLIDACYSGKASDRGLNVQRATGTLHGNLVVLSASSENETAHQYPEKGHGIFTYYLLKKLQDTKGDVTLGDLADYIIDQVQKKSAIINDNMQTPTPDSSLAMKTKWRTLKFY